ncbi:helix-turn-helix domain-containing protein [Nocardia sp. NPDC019395]|uniref:PucR family transcriptional regulator n=1 Tax=Nocardia sp. NPDC019395 TaxID=3154686 RepID=UPI0033FAC12A
MPVDDKPYPTDTTPTDPGAGETTCPVPRTLAATLLSGRSAASVAREMGVVVADSYHVLALDIPVPDRHTRRELLSGGPSRAVPAELVAAISPQALALGTEDGATVLVPGEALTDGDIDAVAGRLTREREIPVVAVHARASRDQLPAVAEQAWEIVDLIRRLRLPAAVYRFDDLALEYQLTRPGPGRDQLGSLLDPLDEHPELTRTLQIHIANNLNRQRTARALHIHPNTVDYRLKRIGELTGLDTNEAPGLWYLRSALVVRGYAADTE